MRGLNQREGPFVPCPHPAVTGRERELRHLTDNLRRVIHLVNTRVFDEDQTKAAVDGLSPVLARLEALVPDPPPARLALDQPVSEPHAGSPYDVVHGLYNPVAPPITIRYEPPEVVGEVEFNAGYEGPPGRVHGAVLIGSFDMVFSSANALAGVTGPTASLKVEYVGATRTDQPAEFRARQRSVEGRRIHVDGELRQHGEVTCRATGLFIQVDRGDLTRLGAGDG
ncbi:MAG: PaaI family thioesterase [Acidimicrobiales bacterium]